MSIRKLQEQISRISRKNLFLKKIARNASNFQVNIDNKLSDEKFAQKQYYKFNKEYLNLDNPKTFNEKLWWLKFHYRNPLEKICSDKYRVREYVKECGLENILVELKGVYDKPQDIPFDKYIDEVFIKINVGSGGNILYNPKERFDKKFFEWDFESQLKNDCFKYSREWNYKDVESKIVCEQVLRDKNGNLPKDWKFMCFDGEPKLLFYSIGACDSTGRHSVEGQRYTNVYDMEFNYVPIESSYPTNPDMLVQIPENFDEMKEYARILSKPFPHCRIDFYNVDGKIYFGEITFYHSGGCGNISPREWAEKMGSWINLDLIEEKYLI